MPFIPNAMQGWAALTSQTLAPLKKSSSSSFLHHCSPRAVAGAGGELPCPSVLP